MQPYLEAGVPLTQLAREHGIPLRTARRWVQQYRQHGLGGLARAPCSDHGRHRLSPELHDLIEGLTLRRPRPSIAAITRRISTIAQRHGWAAPSYSTVYAIVRQFGPALVTLAQEGSALYL